MQHTIPTKRYKNFEFFFDSKPFLLRYTWIFPHKNYVSVGCGRDPKIISPEKLIRNFKKWLSENNIDITNAKYEAFPLNFDYQGYGFGNIF